MAGWGAAVWPAGLGGEGAPAASVTGFLGRGVSNNISEYSGLRACLERAVRDTALGVVRHARGALRRQSVEPYGK